MMRLAVVVGVAVVAGVRADEPPTWPQYGGAGRDFVTPNALPVGPVKARLWRRDLGPGTSGVVSDGAALFTLYSAPDPKKNSQGDEVVVCLDPKTGETKWEHRYPVARLKGQQSFTGEAIRPQATPAVSGGRVCALGYTGLLKCLDATSGKVAWEYDLVKEFGAAPVQFGFSASPLVAGGRFIVHVGGTGAAVVALDPADGKVVWKSKPAEPAYASPVVMPGAGADVVVQVTRDKLLGLSAKDGTERWEYPLPKPGLTNVPTPLVLDKQRLLLSGQGALGTRLLEVTAGDSGATVKEVWKNEKVSFFYANWVADGDAVYGAVGPLFGGLSLKDGQELWRERGQQDANVVRVGRDALLLRGDGRLARCRLSRTGLEELDTYDLLKGRCWTAPTILGRVLYARSEKEITAVQLAPAGER